MKNATENTYNFDVSSLDELQRKVKEELDHSKIKHSFIRYSSSLCTTGKCKDIVYELLDATSIEQVNKLEDSLRNLIHHQRCVVDSAYQDGDIEDDVMLKFYKEMDAVWEVAKHALPVKKALLPTKHIDVVNDVENCNRSTFSM